MALNYSAAADPNHITFGARQGEVYDGVIEWSHDWFMAIAGKSSGKSLLGAASLEYWVSYWYDRVDIANYFVTSPTYNHAEQGMMQAFRERFAHWDGTWNLSRHEYTLPNGHTIFFRSADNPDCLEGLQWVRGGWLDEAGLCPYKIWKNAIGRAAANQAPLIITSTPYGMGWMYTELYVKYMAAVKNRSIEDPRKHDPQGYMRRDRGLVAMDEILLFRNWSSWERPGWDGDVELLKSTLGELELRGGFMGEFVQMEGLVFPDFSESNIVEPFDVPRHWVVTAGVDWGFSHPFGIVVRVHDPAGNCWQVDERLCRGLSSNDMVNIMADVQKTWNVRVFHCDNQKPEIILDAQRAGLHAIGVTKDVQYGISQHLNLIKSGRYKVTSNNIETINAYRGYHWPEPKDARSGPAKHPNHYLSDLMDANRYDTVGLQGFVVSNAMEHEAYTVDEYESGRKVYEWDPREHIERLHEGREEEVDYTFL